MAEKKASVKNTAEKVVVKPSGDAVFAFGKENYVIMVIGLVVIILGFFLMAGKEDIFSTTKLTVAPIVIVLGFIIEVVAIMRKPKD